MNWNGLPIVTYKLTIEIKEKKLTSDELEQASRYISEALSKMGIDHSIECHMDQLKLFRIAKTFLGLGHGPE
jgi:hypothetical protein